MEEKIIEVMVDSGSRPEILKETLPIIMDRLKFTGRLRWMFHEVLIDRKKSEENLKYVESLGVFDVIESNEPLGQAISVGNILEHTRSKYLIHIEDDYILTKEINLDHMWHIMEECGDVNQIAFNRRKTMPDVAGWKKRMYDKANHVLTTSPHWRFTPAMWRLSFIKPLWEHWEGPNGHWALNNKLQVGMDNTNKTAELVAERMGTFYYGSVGEPALCEHVGQGFSNRMEYAGTKETDTKKLHICSGSVYLVGYDNIDVQGRKPKEGETFDKTTFEKYYKHPLKKEPKEDRGNFIADDNWDILSLWPVRGKSIIKVVMIQAVEHFLPYEAEFLVSQVYRVLRMGGQFVFDFPDILQTILRYYQSDPEMMNRLIYCNHKDKYSVHRYSYDEYTFKELLESNGRVWSSIEFKEVVKHDYPVIGGIAIRG